MLNDKQKAFIVNNLWDYGDLTILCCKCAKAEFKIGGNLYVRLKKTVTNRKKDPLYNNLKHKNKRPKPSRQLLQRLLWIKQELKKWIEENTHPDPRDTDTMVFDTNVNGWLSSYKSFIFYIKTIHPEVQKHISFVTYTVLLKREFPTLKKQKHTKDACNSCCTWKAFVESHNKSLSHTRLSNEERLESQKVLDTKKREYEDRLAIARNEKQWYQYQVKQAKKDWQEKRQPT